MALLRYQELLREHALLVRRGDVPHHFERRRVIGALKLARAAQMVIRRLRARGGDPFEIADDRADAATALLVAFATEWKAFGAGVSAVVAIDAFVRAQLARDGWVLRLPPEDLTPLAVGVMVAAAGGLSIDFLGIAATLTARLEGTMGVRERSAVGAYAVG